MVLSANRNCHSLATIKRITAVVNRILKLTWSKQRASCTYLWSYELKYALLCAVMCVASSSAMASPNEGDWKIISSDRDLSSAQTPTRPRAQNNHSSDGADLESLIAAKVSARLGSQWVATALHIAKIESGMRCNPTGNSRANGIFQVVNPNRFGISRAEARTCEGGIAAGVAHMETCFKMGARTSGQMMVCHNAGTPFARRVEKAYRFALR